MKKLEPAYSIILDNKHRYFLDGKRVVNTTSITGKVDKSIPMMYWAAEQTIVYIGKHLEELRDSLNKDGYKKIFADAQKAYKEEASRAADWGTAIHNLIESVNKGEKINLISQPQQVQLGMTAYFDWAKSVNFQSIYRELVVGSKKYQYGGKLDDIGTVNGKLSLLDYKSANGLYNVNKLQIGAYYQALLELYPGQFEDIEKFYVIRFGKNSGEFEYKEILDIQAEINIFNKLLAIYHWDNEKWG